MSTPCILIVEILTQIFHPAITYHTQKETAPVELLGKVRKGQTLSVVVEEMCIRDRSVP